MCPLFVGCYYGKQERRTNNEEIEQEMQFLKEEITEMMKEGEIIIIMDANAKIGILGEEISRNGGKLLKLIDEMNLTVMNTNEKCEGKITRKNTTNDQDSQL